MRVLPDPASLGLFGTGQERFVRLAVLSGDLPARDFDRDPAAYLGCEWLPPKFDYVDPKKDVEAEILAINADDVKALSQPLNLTLEILSREPPLPEGIRWSVRGGCKFHPHGRKFLEEAGHQHSVARVVELELVDAQQVGAAEQLDCLGACALHIVEQPADLSAGEIGVEQQAGALLHPGLVTRSAKFGAEGLGAAVLPDDGAVQRLAGGSGITGGPAERAGSR